MKKTLRGRKSLKRRIFLRNIAEWQLKTVGLFTLVESKEKMLPETRKLLQEYYDDGVRALEKYANKDLSGIWY